jgi:hypothetical protein
VQAGPQFTPAQPGSFGELARQVERQLDSTDAQTVAWGAYNAGAYRVTGAIPVLQQILESPPQVSVRERRALLDVVFDALIQLNARLPASLVVRDADERPVQTYALLARARDRDPILMKLLTKASGLEWYAAADMLFGDKPAELAAHLLTTVHHRLTITVSDGQDGPFGGMVGASSSVSVADGIGENPQGYPPHTEYRFEAGPLAGFLVLAAGPHPVYYSRVVTTSSQYGVSEAWIGGPSDADRIAFIQALLGTSLPTLRAETFESVHWSTVEALIQKVEELRAAIERQYQFVDAELVRRYGRASDAAPRYPHIDVQLVDKRRNRSVPLPMVP